MEGKNDFMIKRKRERRKKILRDASGRLNQEEKKQNSLKQRAWNKLQVQKTECQRQEVKLGVEVSVYGHSTWEGEAAQPEIQGHPQLYLEFKASLG